MNAKSIKRNWRMKYSINENAKYNRCHDPKWIEETRVYCKCGHSVNFFNLIPYIECSFCHRLIFRNKKCEYDYMIKRRFKR